MNQSETLKQFETDETGESVESCESKPGISTLIAAESREERRHGWDGTGDGISSLVYTHNYNLIFQVDLFPLC